MCIMRVRKEILKKMNYFEEKGIKHVRNAISEIKRIRKNCPKCLHITTYGKNERNNALLKIGANL